MIPETISTLQDVSTLVIFNILVLTSLVVAFASFLFGIFLLKNQMWILYGFNLGAQLLGTALPFYIWGTTFTIGAIIT